MAEFLTAKPAKHTKNKNQYREKFQPDATFMPLVAAVAFCVEAG
jgi:hypothetical protein